MWVIFPWRIQCWIPLQKDCKIYVPCVALSNSPMTKTDESGKKVDKSMLGSAFQNSKSPFAKWPDQSSMGAEKE